MRKQPVNIEECLTKEQTQDLVLRFSRYLRRYFADFSRKDWERTVIIMQKTMTGYQLQTLYDPDNAQLRLENPVIVFERPDQEVESGEDAAALWGMVIYTRILGYFAKAKAAYKRGKAKNAEIGRASMLKRWAKYREEQAKQQNPPAENQAPLEENNTEN